VQQAAVQQPRSHTHTIVTLWVFVAVSLLEAVLLWIAIKARGGWTYIATIPFVNLRQLVSLALAGITVIGSGIVGYLSGVWPPEYMVHAVLFAVTVWMGIDVAQYWIKRKTTDPTIASTQNVMAAQAIAGAEVNALTARAVADPGARQPVPGRTAEIPVPPASNTASNAPLPAVDERGDD
jgi:hypothetical protein